MIVAVSSFFLLFSDNIYAGKDGKKIVSTRFSEVPVYNSPNGQIYKMLPKSQLLNKEIIKKQGKWLEIKVNQKNKWVKSLHVSLKKMDIKRKRTKICDEHFKKPGGSTRGLGSC